MRPPELDEATDLIRGSSNPKVFPDPPRPASDALIAAAERHLGLTFPESFKEFQRRFGALGFGGSEFLGLVNENFDTNSDPCAVASTLSARKAGGLPAAFVNIYNLGDGTSYVLDTRHQAR